MNGGPGAAWEPPHAPASPWAQGLLLLRAHFLVLVRRATATTGRRVVTGALVGFGAVASLLLGLTAAAAMYVARRRGFLSPAQGEEAVHLVFVAAWGILALSPALGFRGAEFLDVTRLFVLPVSHRTAFAASTVGISVSGAVLFWVPPLVGLAMGWSSGETGSLPLRLALVVAFVVHAVAVGQLLVLLMLDLLRSRRFHELAMMAAPLAAGSVYLGAYWVLSRGREGLGDATGIRAMLSMGISERIPFVPSMWLSHAFLGAEGFEMGRWLPFLAGFLPLTWAAFRAAAVLQERAFLGDVPPVEAGVLDEGMELPGSRWLRRWFPDEVLAVASKELRLLRREPLVRTMLLGQGVFLLVPVILLALGRDEGAADALRAGRFVWLLPFVLVFVQNTLTMNLLGLEGPGFLHLATTPLEWRSLFVGKDLCYLLAFGVLNAVICSGVLVFVAALRPDLLPSPGAAVAEALAGGTAAQMIVLAVGNVASVHLPFPLTVRGRMALRQQGALAEGCYEKVARLAVFAVAAALVAPVPLLLHVLPAFAPWFFQETWWPPVGAVLSLAYAALLLRKSLPMAVDAARDRTAFLVERLARGGE